MHWPQALTPPCHPCAHHAKQDLTYTVKHSQKRREVAVLLNKVTAHLNPGEMSALVRASCRQHNMASPPAQTLSHLPKSNPMTTAP